MDKIEVQVYAGKNVNGGGCGCSCAGCGATNENVAEEYQHMVDILKGKYKEDEISFSFVNTEDQSLVDFPAIERVIMNGYSFPITVINETPYLAGALDAQAVTEIIDDLRQATA